MDIWIYEDDRKINSTQQEMARLPRAKSNYVDRQCTGPSELAFSPDKRRHASVSAREQVLSRLMSNACPPAGDIHLESGLAVAVRLLSSQLANKPLHRFA